jgi:hypothetical protein
MQRLPVLRRIDVWEGADTKGIDTLVLMLKRDGLSERVTWEVKDTFTEQKGESAA